MQKDSRRPSSDQMLQIWNPWSAAPQVENPCKSVVRHRFLHSRGNGGAFSADVRSLPPSRFIVLHLCQQSVQLISISFVTLYKYCINNLLACLGGTLYSNPALVLFSLILYPHWYSLIILLLLIQHPQILNILVPTCLTVRRIDYAAVIRKVFLACS